MTRYETFCDRIVQEEEFHDTQLDKFQDAVSRVLYERYVLILLVFKGLARRGEREERRASRFLLQIPQDNTH
jgi:hypothetical protein